MPTPPKKGESKKDFISRCMVWMSKNEPKKSQEQRLAICYSYWDRQDGKSLYSISNDGKTKAFDYRLKSIETDTKVMSATAIFATEAIDRQREILRLDGLDTENHKKSPVILLDHGLSYNLPIGKAETPNGEYTVRINGTEAIQTTFFSQSDPVAEQVYELITEEILRGNSIGFRPRKTKAAQVDGMTVREIVESELVEASWTALGVNPECLALTNDILGKDQLSGKAIRPEVKALLLPYQLPKRAWSSGITLIKSKSSALSTLDESRGAPLVGANQMQPHGSQVITSLHKAISDVLQEHQPAHAEMDNTECKAGLSTVCHKMEECLSEMADLHDEHYPDAEKLEHKELYSGTVDKKTLQADTTTGGLEYKKLQSTVHGLTEKVDLIIKHLQVEQVDDEDTGSELDEADLAKMEEINRLEALLADAS